MMGDASQANRLNAGYGSLPGILGFHQLMVCAGCELVFNDMFLYCMEKVGKSLVKGKG